MIRTPVEDLDDVVREAADVWSLLDGATVLLTGVTGFVGTWVLEALAHARTVEGCRVAIVLPVRSVARFRERFPHHVAADWIATVEGDIRSFALPPCEVDFVIHAASTVSATHLQSYPIDSQSVVTDGTVRLFEQSIRAGVRRVLLMSSGSVYGRNYTYGASISESGVGFTDPADASRVLPEAKRCAEALAASIAAQHGVELVTARGFGMSGPWLPLDGTFALGNFVRDALAGEPIRIHGDGTAVRSYLYGADVARWVLTLLLRGQANTPYNLGSAEAVTIRDLAHRVAFYAGASVAPVAEFPISPVDYFVPDCTRAHRLGLDATVGLDEAIRRMLFWHTATR